jgi:hypothetical protein
MKALLRVTLFLVAIAALDNQQLETFDGGGPFPPNCIPKVNCAI